MAEISSWIGFWNGNPPIYVSDRHKVVHYRAIAADIARHIPGPDARVLDYGCGEALSAADLAGRCGQLYLTDAAETVAAGLAHRLAGTPKATVVPFDALETAIPVKSIDLAVVNSVAQYMTPDDLASLVSRLRPLLRDDGTILFADIIPPDVSAVFDARALLRLAAANGFLVSAFVGLARTSLSNYRTLRERLGLTRYREDEFATLMARADFTCRRVIPNLGHNQSRMAFIVTPKPSAG